MHTPFRRLQAANGQRGVAVRRSSASVQGFPFDLAGGFQRAEISMPESALRSEHWMKVPNAAPGGWNYAVLRGPVGGRRVREGVGREVRCHQVRQAPSEDLPDEDVDDESSLSLRHLDLRMGGVGGPELAKTSTF